MQPRKRGLRPKEVTGVGPGPEGIGARTQAGTALRAPEERAGHKPGPQPVPPELRGACVRPLCRRHAQGRGQPSLCSFLRERPPVHPWQGWVQGVTNQISPIHLTFLSPDLFSHSLVFPVGGKCLPLGYRSEGALMNKPPSVDACNEGKGDPKRKMRK